MLPVLPGEDVVAGEMETDTGQAGQRDARPGLFRGRGRRGREGGGARDSDRGPGLARGRHKHRRGHRGGGEQHPGAPAPEVRGRRVTADKEGEKTTDEVSEENKAEEAPEVAVPEPEVSSSTTT